MGFYNFKIGTDLLDSFNISKERGKELSSLLLNIVLKYPTLFSDNNVESLAGVISLIEASAKNDDEVYFLIYKIGGSLALGVEDKFFRKM